MDHPEYHILIVAEIEARRVTLVDDVRGDDCAMTVVENAEQAFQAMAAHAPDAILLDTEAAFDAWREAWKPWLDQDLSSRAPLIVALPVAASEEIVKFFEAGARDCLVGPVDRAELTARLRAAARQGSAIRSRLAASDSSSDLIERLRVLPRAFNQLTATGSITNRLGRLAELAVEACDLRSCQIWCRHAATPCPGGCASASSGGDGRCVNQGRCLHLAAAAGQEECTAIGRNVMPLGSVDIGGAWSLMQSIENSRVNADQQWMKILGPTRQGASRPAGEFHTGLITAVGEKPISPDEDALLGHIGNVAGHLIRVEQLETVSTHNTGQFMRAFEAADNAALLITNDRFIDCNSAAVKMLGYSDKRELLRRAPAEFSPPEQPDGRPSSEKAGEMNALARAHGVHRFEWTHLRADGQPIPIEVTLSTTGLGGGEKLLALWRDLTKDELAEEEHRNYEAVLESANLALEEFCEAAKAADQAKTEFLANVSHELRTPLHAILSFTTFGLKKAESPKPDDMRKYFTRIDGNAKTLLEFVNALLDVSKLEAGKGSIDKSKLDLRNQTLLCIDELSSLAAEQNIQISFHAERTLPPVSADRTRIAQVLRNLLGNAIKFAPQGTTIAVSLEHQDDELHVAVRDQGPGIPEDELDSIFEKFVQSSRTRSGAGGTGLGLSICREIMSAHAGRIWARNNPDQGATFSLAMPCHPTPVAEPETDKTTDADGIPAAESPSPPAVSSEPERDLSRQASPEDSRN